MSNEAYTSISNRVVSLEDIIRQQEQTIGTVLQRLRDVEQYAASEARNRQQTQQQLYQLLGERGGSSAEAAQQMQAILQNQNERLSAVQADVQGQAAALRGLDDKYSAALHGLEQRMQSDVGGVQQRAQTGETASMEAMRNLQAQLQGVSNATQAVDARCRDDLLAVQQQLTVELAAQRQRADNLENAIRDALRDVHGSLMGELRSADTQHRTELDGAVQRVNKSLEALDQRTRADMNQLHSVEQGDVSELGRRIEDAERNQREMLQASTNGLASEVAQVAQHSQNLDRRQAAAHQTLLQELAKHDGQLESVDLNWRASVTDLGAMMRESMAAAQQQAAAGDQALQRQCTALESRLTAATESFTRNVNELGHTVQENCVQPINEMQRALSAQEQRLSRVADEYAAVQDSMKTFASRVDQDASQFKQVVEAAVRASHADLLERINFASAAITMQQDPEAFRVEVNRALKKLWDDAKGVFLTQRSLGDMQAQLAALENAVRVELCALAERNNAVQQNVEGVRLAQQRAGSEAGRKETAAKVESPPSPPPPPPPTTTTTTTAKTVSPLLSPKDTTATTAGSQKASTPSPVLSKSPPPQPRSPLRFTSAAQADTAPGRNSPESQVDEPLPPPQPPIQAFAVEPTHDVPAPPHPKVEEIERDNEEEEQEHIRPDVRWRQHEKAIDGLRASLNRLRQTQLQASDKASVDALRRMEDRAAEGEAADTESPRPHGALQDARSAASEAGESSREAKGAAAHAEHASREARGAAAAAAESLQAAKAMQDDALKVANELRLALKRVEKTEATLQQRLTELRAVERASDVPFESGSVDRTAHLSRTSATTEFVSSPSSLPTGAAVDEGQGEHGKTTEEEARQRRSNTEGRPPKARPMSTVAVGQVTDLPKIDTRPASAPEQAPSSTSPSAAEKLMEVPGLSKGEVFIVRQETSNRPSPASLRQRLSLKGAPPLAPTPLKESTATAATKPATPSESDLFLPAVRRGSGLTEVLLPTHQFVRKREYNNFKDFTKQEVDALWVELLNLRRSQGMPKEAVLLELSQSKEKLLSTVLQIVQRQEKETLEMLSSIQTQLLDLRSDQAATREVKVFPIEGSKHLEEFMRAISADTPRHSTDLVTRATRPPSTSAPRQAPSSAPERRTSPWRTASSNERVTRSSAPMLLSPEREADTTLSSARSASPLTPQIIPKVVHNRTSLPSKAEPTEVFFTESDHSHPQHLISQPQRSQSTSPQLPTATLSGPQQAHHYVVAAPVDPSTVSPVARPVEPDSATPQYRPTGLQPPATKASPTKESRPSSGKVEAARRLSLLPPSAADAAAAQQVGSPYVSAGVPSSGPLSYAKQSQDGGDGLLALTRLLVEGKSPRNSVGNAFHLSPLEGPGSRGSNAQTSLPRREPGEPPNIREDPQESNRRMLEEEPKPHESRPPRYDLLPLHPPPLPAVPKASLVDLPPPPLTDTSPDKYQPMSIQDGSEIYYASVEDQRPTRRRSLRRSSAAADNTPTRRASDAGVVRRTLPPEHLYQRHASVTAPQSGHDDDDESPPRPREPQQPRRDRTPTRGPATEATRTDTPPTLRRPSVHVLPSKGPIHLGPYNPPRLEEPLPQRQQQPDEDRRAGPNTRRPSRLSSPSSLQHHADHNPHVYAPISGREWDVYSTSQSLAVTSSSSPGGGSRGRASASSRRSAASPMVPMRILDAPANVSTGNATKPTSSATIRIHPYREEAEEL
ncbi:hypothetical protein ABB37_05279 [Leptomonas pyrrhocoris]|uniref:Uncharacterized protein n=1 Tax=Leptomonas pyrrhocoris TaxID=157538 RepID=A0A0N0DUV5_LEPPY|nr:hypothetical protein ABB37_05279 [Leptomonas pyrrhocoris]KPA79441.1 hypothetical protein ABB37_05279 [Leptomonas pyrrhocoris]|eukprot:XP_015657880.1 hypothetical protein ABB37_05279 [Leptomonas pyrrhocoris]